ncbi:uncharacterized protein C8R40DRAFT_1069002 [Lentinula edodes]|uniref:uncharacterized protein n=1 Tax=Lentinula edodes TaxID=5353 RepID=UPI001E8CBB5F|nr:uncharacterized protein C8R40DRAFT_1069002 [Lentinula edodes]KAH7875777.1 hypothetical protein C8R40DRAFT_1069002 [Lentinula edodes]
MAPSTQDPSHGNNARPDHSSPSSNSTSTVGSKEKWTTVTKSDEPSSSILSSFHKVFVNGVPLADYVKEDPHWNLLLDIATPCMECEHKRIECTVPAKYPRCEPCGSSNCSISHLARHRAFARQHGKDLAFSRKFLDEHGVTKKDSYTIPLNYWRTYDSLLRKWNHPPEISAEFRIFEQNEDLTTQETSPDPQINESSVQLLSKPSKEKKKVPKCLTEEATPKDTKKGKGWAEETTAKNTKKGKKRSAEESVPPDTNKAKRRLTEESLSKDDETGKGRSAEEALPKDNKKGKGCAVNDSLDTLQRESNERSQEHNKLQEECSLSNKRLCQAQHTLDERNAMAARQQVLIEELNETLQIYESRASGAESLIQTYYQDSQDPLSNRGNLPAVPNFDQRMVLWDHYLQVYLEALLNGTPLEPVCRILDDPLREKSHPPAVDTSLPHGGVEPTDVASDESYVKNLSMSCGGPVPGSPDENIATASSSSVSIVDGPIEEKTVDLSSDNGSLFTP